MSRRVLSLVKVVVLSLIHLLILVSVVCAIVTWLLFMFGWNEGSKTHLMSHKESETYKMTRYNPHNDKTSFGFVSIPTFSDESYQSFIDSNGDHVLVSPIQSKKSDFKCHGSCFCRNDVEEQEKRRLISFTSSSSRKMLMYLVSAATTTFAIESARNHFKETCDEKLSETCDSQSIQSEVTTCTHISMSDSVTEETETKTNEDGNVNPKDEEKESKKFRKYVCRGVCLPNVYGRVGAFKNAPENEVIPDSLQIELTQYSREFKCEDMTLEKEVLVDTKKNQNVQFLMMTEAQDRFIFEILHPYCIQNSWQEFHVTSFKKKCTGCGTCGKTEEKIEEEAIEEEAEQCDTIRDQNFPMCVGHNARNDNPRVFCRDTGLM